LVFGIYKRYKNTRSFIRTLLQLIVETTQAYENYRKLVGGEAAMNVDIQRRFVEVQALILSPIATHVCEYVWSLLRPKDGLIINARWPECGEINELALKQCRYLFDTVEEFRQKRDLANKKSKDRQARRAVIYVASSEPSWKKTIVSIITPIYQEKHQLPEEKELQELFKKEENEIAILQAFESSKKNTNNLATKLTSIDKAKMYEIMTFISSLKSQLETKGEAALRLEFLFDEAALIIETKAFFLRSLSKPNVEFSDIEVIVLHENDSIYQEFQKPPVPGSPVIRFKDQEGNAIA